MANINFEVTKKSTIVTCTGLTGNTDVIEITGTDIEKDFIKILKKLQEQQLAVQVMNALDVSKWEEVKES